MVKKKDNSMFGILLAGIAAAIAGVVGMNELSKSRGKTSSSNSSLPPPPPPSKKDGGCGCGM